MGKDGGIREKVVAGRAVWACGRAGEEERIGREEETDERDGEMSKTSFKTFCVEFYADHVGKTGPEVYAEFEKSGLLRELDRDYEDLHGMGMEALMQLFDQWFGKAAAK